MTRRTKIGTILGFALLTVLAVVLSSSHASAAQKQSKTSLPRVGVPAISHHTGPLLANGTHSVSVADVTAYTNETHPTGLHWDLVGTPHFDVRLSTMSEIVRLSGEPSPYPDNMAVYIVTYHNKNIVVPYYQAPPHVTYTSFMVYDAATGNFLLSMAA